MEVLENTDEELVRRNSIAIGDTLEHHGKILTKIQEEMDALRMEIAMIKQDQILQKNMIVKSLTQKYGTGPTA